MSDLADRVKEKTGQSDEQAETETKTSDLLLDDTLYRWLEDRAGYFERALPAHLEREAPTFTLCALTHIRRSDALMRCDKDTLLMALIQAAHFGLLPDGKQCALVPYGKEARFMPMVEGLTDMMYRSGAVTSVRRGLIRKNDTWAIEPSAPPPHDFSFRPDLLADRGEPIIAYAFCWMRGGGRSEVLTFTRAEAEAHRDRYSKAYQNAEKARQNNATDFEKNPYRGKYHSTWHDEFNKMWQKTPVRMLAKEVSTSPEMRLLLLADDAADSTINDGPYRPVLPLDPGDWQELPGAPDALGEGPENPEGGAAAGADWPPVAEPGSGQ